MDYIVHEVSKSRTQLSDFHFHMISITWLLLGRRAMINLDSILKSRDITLLTKVCIVKAMVFPVVMLDMRAGPQRRLSSKELMLLNCGSGKDF